ncbi:class I SAM-dependent methyltransferase [Desertibaculum subflavum]|uniref:class I SAM-dependent methyltransferase n=1 Tax=Desertibaculum subflavum TaxID=2268458 RepID=UPI000E66D782
MIADPAAFIRANTRLLPVPHAPEIRLHLADEATALWEKTEEELGALGLPPPYWAFAWAGGQALARHILDRPAIVRGKRVLDFASGSGLVAIAAMQAGASRVAATEIDGFALTAIEINAVANGIVLEILSGDVLERPVDPAAWDVVLAGDVCYERPMAERVILWLEAAAAAGIEVLLGDPGRSYLPKHRLERLAEYSVPTTRALEDAEIKRTSVWALRAR